MDALAEEVSSIRSVQLDLKRRFDRLTDRIDAVETMLGSRNIASEPPAPPPPVPEAFTPPDPAFDEPPSKFILPPLPTSEPDPVETCKTTAATESFEMRFGQVWLVRIGIVVLLTGLVFLGNFAYHEFIGRVGAFGKLALLYLAACGLSFAGWRLQRRETFRSFGRVLLGGGLATLYYATYAAHFVPTLRVIGSPLIAGALLLALGGAFVWLADRLRSSLLAGTTIALAFYTAAINPIGNFSLFSNLVISAAGVILLVRRQWSGVSILTLAGTYGAFAFWRLHQSGSFVATPEPAAFLPAILFPAAYWIVHTAAVLWRRTTGLDPAIRPVYLTINNAAFFALITPVIASRHPDSLWLCALVFGAVLILLSVAAGRSAPAERTSSGSYLTQGLGLVFVALIFKLTGWSQPVAFALFSGTLLGISRLRHGGIFRIFAAAAAVIAGVTAAGNIANGEDHSRIVGVACAILLTANGWILRARKGLKETPFDLEVAVHVTLGCILAILSASFGNLPDSGLRLLGIGLLATLSLRVVRLPELVGGGQLIVLFGQAALIVSAITEGVANPLWSITVSTILIAWWQWRTSSASIAARTWQSLHCVAPVVITLLWVAQKVPASWQGATLAGIAWAVIAAGFASRAWPVAIAGSAFTFAAFLTTGRVIFAASPWAPGLVALAILLSQGTMMTALGHRAPLAAAGSLLALCRILRAAVSTWAVWMLLSYAPASAWLLSLSAAAGATLILAALVKSREAVCHAAAFATIGIISWLAQGFSASAQPIDLAAFGIGILAQRVMRKRMDWLPVGAHVATIAMVCSGLWLLTHRLLTTYESGFLITITWSLLAFAILGAGFFWRERTYRLAGLVILIAALLRIFFVDVWALETIFRIVSFLVLGIVLIALSFLYNRHAAALRKWL